MTLFNTQHNSPGNHPPDYVVVFSDGPDPSETRFRAGSDEEATERMHKQYPEADWMLFRIAGNERWHVHVHHGREARPEDTSVKARPEAP